MKGMCCVAANAAAPTNMQAATAESRKAAWRLCPTFNKRVMKMNTRQVSLVTGPRARIVVGRGLPAGRGVADTAAPPLGSVGSRGASGDD